MNLVWVMRVFFLLLLFEGSTDPEMVIILLQFMWYIKWDSYPICMMWVVSLPKSGGGYFSTLDIKLVYTSHRQCAKFLSFATLGHPMQHVCCHVYIYSGILRSIIFLTFYAVSKLVLVIKIVNISSLLVSYGNLLVLTFLYLIIVSIIQVFYVGNIHTVYLGP